MIDLRTVDHIYLVTGSTDLRKAADGDSAIVQYDLNMNPFTVNGATLYRTVKNSEGNIDVFKCFFQCLLHQNRLD